MAIYNVDKSGSSPTISQTAGRYGGIMKLTGNNLNTLVAALADMTDNQKSRCDIVINNTYVVTQFDSTTYINSSIQANGSVISYILDTSVPVFKSRVGSTDTTITVTGWKVLYADDSISGGNTYPADRVSVEGDLDVATMISANPLSHNCIYTGRNLGTISSASDWAAFRAKYGIADKSYKGLYLGDYVKVNDGTYNADWMVAGFNTETNKGSTNICPECVSMIPRVGDGCGTSYMNSTNVTTGGYVGSYMHATKLPAIATKLTTIFGSNLLTRDILASNTVTNGYASNWAWTACKCSLLTSVQVYGSLSFENTGGTYFAGYNIGEGCEKLPVFNFINPVQFSRSIFWLRGVSGASNFCLVGGGGVANFNSASAACGVRPLICLS